MRQGWRRPTRVSTWQGPGKLLVLSLTDFLHIKIGSWQATALASVVLLVRR